MMKTEVRLGGWCEGGLRQQRNDGGGCVKMCERSESGEQIRVDIREWSGTKKSSPMA